MDLRKIICFFSVLGTWKHIAIRLASPRFPPPATLKAQVKTPCHSVPNYVQHVMTQLSSLTISPRDRCSLENAHRTRFILIFTSSICDYLWMPVQRSEGRTSFLAFASAQRSCPCLRLDETRWGEVWVGDWNWVMKSLWTISTEDSRLCCAEKALDTASFNSSPVVFFRCSFSTMISTVLQYKYGP